MNLEYLSHHSTLQVVLRFHSPTSFFFSTPPFFLVAEEEGKTEGLGREGGGDGGEKASKESE